MGVFLAVLVCISVAGSIHAADFFPLDVWEEMRDWQCKKDVGDGFGPKADQRPMSPGPAAFPWDVREALNALGGDAGPHGTRFSLKIVASRRKGANPYWLPEELQADPRPNSMTAGFEAYLTDSR